MTILETRDLYFTYPDGENRKVILNDKKNPQENRIFGRML